LYFKIIYDDNLFVTVNVKQLRTGGSFRILQPFFQISWDVVNLNSAIFISFHNWVDFGGPSEFVGGGGGFLTSQTPPPPPSPLPLGGGIFS